MHLAINSGSFSALSNLMLFRYKRDTNNPLTCVFFLGDLCWLHCGHAPVQLMRAPGRAHARDDTAACAHAYTSLVFDQSTAGDTTDVSHDSVL